MSSFLLSLKFTVTKDSQGGCLVFERYLKVGLGKKFFVGARAADWLVAKGWW